MIEYEYVARAPEEKLADGSVSEDRSAGGDELRPGHVRVDAAHRRGLGCRTPTLGVLQGWVSYGLMFPYRCEGEAEQFVRFRRSWRVRRFLRFGDYGSSRRRQLAKLARTGPRGC